MIEINTCQISTSIQIFIVLHVKIKITCIELFFTKQLLSYKLFTYDILFIFFFYLNNFNITAFKRILNGNYIHTTLSAPWNFITIALIKKSNPKSFLCVNCCFSSFWLIIGYSYLNNFQSKYCHTKYLNLLFHPAFSIRCIKLQLLQNWYL